MLQTFESHEGYHCPQEVQSSWPTSRSYCIRNPEDASVHWESVSMQFLPCQFQQNASLSCVLFSCSWLFLSYMQPPQMILYTSPVSYAGLLLLLTMLHQFPCHDWTLARDSRFWGQFYLPVWFSLKRVTWIVCARIVITWLTGWKVVRRTHVWRGGKLGKRVAICGKISGPFAHRL